MRARLALVVGVGLAAACSASGTGPAGRGTGSLGGSSQGSASLRGVANGFTGAPDSQVVAISGANVTLTRVADLPTPTPPQGDTTAAGGGSDPGCQGTVVASLTTGADGSWQVGGLEEGIYTVKVAPPAGSQYQTVERCGVPVQDGADNQLIWYLPLAATGP